MKHITQHFSSKAWSGPLGGLRGWGQRPLFNFIRIWSCCASNLSELHMQEHDSNYFARRPP